ncbi:hypothetical protein M433DRAFT_149344 [Acidomyces richmondensis BFW]|nr:MAG: hypothetical protein FE78DRAFT_88755 [Acidomyces sp. 'richmondensis']KYG50093.1 hypothetical protein M433DRAFT_149344 [Acidomyces richmondensis BFW]
MAVVAQAEVLAAGIVVFILGSQMSCLKNSLYAWLRIWMWQLKLQRPWLNVAVIALISLLRLRAV